MTDDRAGQAELALRCLDLTNLDDNCTPSDVAVLCERADTPYGPLAAVCVWPRFVAQAGKSLSGSGVKVATVVNFPHGGTDERRAVGETQQALEDGADEIDLVIPYRTLEEGPGKTRAMVAAVAETLESGAGLKAILETGELGSVDLVRRASEAAVDGGATFLKTSTGKTAVSATPEAARTMLEVIRERGGTVGLKPSGGLRTLDDVLPFFGLCDEILGPGWIDPERFRLGASSLLDALLDELG